MNKKVEEVSKGIRAGLLLIVRLFIAFIEVLLMVIVITGSVTSMILLYKMYPNLFIRLIVSISPMIVLIITILKFLGGLFIGIGIGYLLFRLVVYMIYLSKKNKKIREKKRDKFLDDLADKIIKKTKKKK